MFKHVLYVILTCLGPYKKIHYYSPITGDALRLRDRGLLCPSGDFMVVV